MKKNYLLLLLLMLAGSANAQNICKNIIVDQFGYLPDSKKIAVIKNPITGFDSNQTYIPGNTFSVVNANTGERVLTAAPVAWNGGQTDLSSGDKVWQFDFSAVTANGRYYILDVSKNKRSYEFEISPIVYKEVLKQAVRFFFYQRSGYQKDANYAGVGWADGASHIGPLQDKNCRLFNAPNDSTTETDVSGGWYDAGDYNKYTNWTASYIVEMMKAYIENPSAWGDDYNIPESGNSIPDLLDEMQWGIKFLLKMQRLNGGVLCIVGESHASPPSAAHGPSLYGPATTSATLNAAAAFALSSKVYRSIGQTNFADTLLSRAQQAWNWAILNPSVVFHNNDPNNSSLGVGAGDQEEDAYTRSMSRLKAACYLYEVTSNSDFRNYFDTAYLSAHEIQWTYVYPFEASTQDILLYYTTLPGATSSVVTKIKNSYNTGVTTNTDNFPAYYNRKDPYLAQLGAYTWGSNAAKSNAGSIFYNVISYKINPAKYLDAREAALNYVHYIHGVNPLNMVYLSNMYKHGAENCVNTFYHSWFAHGSAKWDKVGVSTYGPPPGYLTGGANPGYNWYSGCPNNCGSAENNAACLAESITPPKGQPDQKSYKDFNTSWPIDSWEVTEPSCGYQVSYLRLLSKFVTANMDCHGDTNGTAYLDTCRVCSGGNTGRNPELTACNCSLFEREKIVTQNACNNFSSPSGKYLWTSSGTYNDTLPSINGCDSILTINLSIGHPSLDSIYLKKCNEYFSPSGKYKWTNSGIFHDTIPNTAGCDSLMTINLKIIHSTSAILNIVACDYFPSPSGRKTWYISGTFLDTIPSAEGCDSLITVNLVISKPNFTISNQGDTLFANIDSSSFQWLDCNKNKALIAGATGFSFQPSRSGDYAVIVTKNNCTDTSGCFHLILSGIQRNDRMDEIYLYPNPTKGNFEIELPMAYGKANIEIINTFGQTIMQKITNGDQKTSIFLDAPVGIYFMKIRNSADKLNVLKLLKE